MNDRLTSDTSFWLKFVRSANLSISNTTALQYSMALADQFSKTNEILDVDENVLNRIGITNQADRSRLIAQARSLEEKVNSSLALKRRSAAASRIIESWLGESQSTPSNRNPLSKSTCNLSPSLSSRISLNDRPVSVVYPYDEPGDEIRKRNFSHIFEPQEKVITVDDNGKIKRSTYDASPLEYQGVLKKTPSSSSHGLRTLKSVSDAISLQKKVPTGADRLKRLDSSISLFQRQTSFITKKVTNLANKFVNPFAHIKKKVDTSSTEISSPDSLVDLRTTIQRQCVLVEKQPEISQTVRRTVTITSMKRSREDDEQSTGERRKVQVLSVNNQIRPPTGLFSFEEEPKRQVVPVQTLGSKRFKLGATTSFLTRSLANHGLME